MVGAVPPSTTVVQKKMEPPAPPAMDSTLVLVVVVYFLQGALSLSRLATSYYLKDEVGLSAGDLGAVTGLFSLPWVFKPAYGLLSDTRPILGSRRKAYLGLSGLVGCASFLALAAAPSKDAVIAANLVGSLSVAVADVVADSIVVEKSDSDATAKKLQSASWASRYVGAIGASLLAGPALGKLGSRGAWLATAPLPLLVAAASTAVEEEPPVDDEQPPLRALLRALSSPEILRPALFLFLWQATPSCGTAFFVFATSPQGLNFDPDFIGLTSAVGAAAGLAGVGLYNLAFKNARLSTVILGTSIASAVLGCAPLILVYHLNRGLLDDRLFAVGDDVLQAALGEVSFLPLLVLASRICPPGVEGALFATLMSIFNLGGLVSQETGAFLTNALHVDQPPFDNLGPLIVLCSASSLLPLLVLDWVKDAEGQEEVASSEDAPPKVASSVSAADGLSSESSAGSR